MKKNIAVNISGVLYPIDEDAYELLKRYLDNMRAYFSRQEGGKEIADDIESRAAELMGELHGGNNTPVTIEDVQYIINRIGSPEELGGVYDDDARTEPSSGVDAGEEYGMPEVPVRAVKKLYRDVEHKILGGVLAGLGYYIGVNPKWLRLLVIILALMTLTGILALPVFVPPFLFIMTLYIVCWAAIPAADTPAQRLEMRGEPVNIDNLRDEILNDTPTGDNAGGRTFIDGFGRMVGFLFKSFFYVSGAVVLLISAVILIGLLVYICWYLLSSIGNVGIKDTELGQMMSVCPLPLLWLCCISMVVALALTVGFGVYVFMRSMKRVIAISTPVILGCVIAWVVAVVLSIGSWVQIAHIMRVNRLELNRMRVEQREERREKQRKLAEDQKKRREQINENRNREQLKLLEEQGWRAVKNRNLDAHYMMSGEHYSGNKERFYLDAYNKSGDMTYEVVRTVKVAPGIYTLQAVARTDGNGCEVFAVNGADKRYAVDVPVCGNKGGSVWADAKKALEVPDSVVLPDRDRLSALVRVNRSKGYGWSRVAVNGIKVGADSVLTYGVTNDVVSKTWDGTWLSATAFELSPEHGR